MRQKTLLVPAVLLALGVCGQALAQNQTEEGAGSNYLADIAVDIAETDDHSGNDRNNSGRARADGLGNAAANNNSTATANWSNSFNTSTAVATTELYGVVTGNAVHDLGNAARNRGGADGGDGGSGGWGLGGSALGGEGDGGDGGDGGDAGAISARDGDAWSASRATSRARARADSTADGTATSGDASADNAGSSGTAMASSGLGGTGGSGTGGDGTGGDGTGGSGGDGGDGGSVANNAGTFNMYNTMDGTANAAAGIMVVAQNSGASTLIQQGVTVQANLAVGN